MSTDPVSSQYLSRDELKAFYDAEGYVIVPNLIGSEEQLLALEQATERVIAKTRAGEWTHRRTVGKQFPPFDTKSARPDVWGVQHVMHPDLGEREFIRWYAGDEVCGVARLLLGCEEEHLQMELFNILINPEEHDFALRWHRDDVPETASEAEEVEALAKSHYGVQWNTALHHDDALFVVPGSHKVPRTPEQRAQSSTMDPPADPMTMPGVLRVVLKRGDTVFYNNNILHCAAYSSTTPRATLHACMGDTRGGSARARNILQHGLDWMRSEQFQETLPRENEDGGRAKRMLERLVELAGKNQSVGYSLKG